MTDNVHKLPIKSTPSGKGSGLAGFKDDEAELSGHSSHWSAVDWDDIVPRLLLLAMSRLSRMTWRGQRGAVAPGPAEAEDFVNDAIAKTIAGIRVWSEERCTLFQHLAGVVVSDISHASRAAENRLTVSNKRPSENDDWPPDRADEKPDQEQQALWRSEQRRLLGHLDEVDPRLAEMAELILVEDIESSADLAKRLDCSTTEIANLRKRMKRALRVFLLAGEEVEI